MILTGNHIVRNNLPTSRALGHLVKTKDIFSNFLRLRLWIEVAKLGVRDTLQMV